MKKDQATNGVYQEMSRTRAAAEMLWEDAFAKALPNEPA
jgi:hypothetical protein